MDHWNLVGNYFHSTLQYSSFYSEYFQNIIICGEYCLYYPCILDCTFGVVDLTFPFYTDILLLLELLLCLFLRIQPVFSASSFWDTLTL